MEVVIVLLCLPSNLGERSKHILMNVGCVRLRGLDLVIGGRVERECLIDDLNDLRSRRGGVRSQRMV